MKINISPTAVILWSCLLIFLGLLAGSAISSWRVNDVFTEHIEDGAHDEAEIGIEAKRRAIARITEH